MSRPYKLAVFTTTQPHHSNKSGYEQAAEYVQPDFTLWRTRNNTPAVPKRAVAKLLRPYALSNWYQWDGVEAERKAFRLSRKHSGHLITHFLYGDTSLGLLPRFRNRFRGKVIATIHACPSDYSRVFANPHLLHALDFIILLGKIQRDKLLEWGVSERKMLTVPHGVDLNFFKPDQFNRNKDAPFRVLAVGNWRRNFSLYQKVIEAFAGEEQVRFDIVTASHNHRYFKDYPNVCLYDGLSDKELLKHYQQTDCVLLGLEDAVANNVLLEAMACAQPVIVENVGAVGEYVNEQCGIPVPPDDAAAVVEAIRELRDQPELRNKLGRKAAEHVKRFDWQVVAKELQAVYDMIYHERNL